MTFSYNFLFLCIFLSFFSINNVVFGAHISIRISNRPPNGTAPIEGLLSSFPSADRNYADFTLIPKADSVKFYTWVYDTHLKQLRWTSDEDDSPTFCLTTPLLPNGLYATEMITLKECANATSAYTYEGHRGNVHSGMASDTTKLTVNVASQSWDLKKIRNDTAINIVHEGSHYCLRGGIPADSYNKNNLIRCYDPVSDVHQSDVEEDTLLHISRLCTSDHYPCDGHNSTKSVTCLKDNLGMYAMDVLEEGKICTHCDTERVDSVCDMCDTVKFSCAACPSGLAGDGNSCTACVDGSSFTNHSDELVCSPCNVHCNPGQHPGLKCNVTSDLSCIDCPNGTVSVKGDACVDCIACQKGTGMSAPCTTTTDTVCKACIAGKTFSADSSSTSKCTNCTVCAEGLVVSQACTPLADTVCGKCPLNQWDNKGKCEACLVCPAGQRILTECKPSANAVCTTLACPAGSFSTNGGPCLPCTKCDPGFGQSHLCTPTSDTVCTACVNGTSYSSTLSDTDTCLSCLKCTANAAETKTCDAKSNSVCETCLDSYFVTPDKKKCKACTTCKRTYKTCTAVSDAVCATGKGHTVQVILITFICIIVTIIVGIAFRSYVHFYYHEEHSFEADYSIVNNN